jgi:quercetin dioxygenase-like cupin family protein
MVYFTPDSIPERTSISGLPVKILSGEHLMLSLIDLPAGFSAPAHRHPNEQISYVLSGAVIYDVEGETITGQAGGVFLIPANCLHAIRIPADGPARLLDVYSPPRDEYR